MTYKPKNLSKWLFLALGLFVFNQSFAFKSNLTRQINGQDGTDARIEEGSTLFNANCASCHALNGKVVGPALGGVIDKYDQDYEWLIAWIKNNQKLIKSGDERALKIYNEYNGQAMNLFENLSDDQITSLLMWIDNGGDGDAPAAAETQVIDAPVDESVFNNVNWALVFMILLVFAIIVLIFGILELVSNITGREIVNWNNVNAFMMLIFVFLFFALAIYEYKIHGKLLLPQSASEHGVELDKMMTWTWYATLPIFFITQFLLFYFSFRYRQQPGRKAFYYPHNNNLEYVWTIIPAIVLAALVSGGFKTWNKVLRSEAKADATVIEVFAYQFGWNARYAGENGQLGKANYNLINGVNPLGVANREHATGLIAELEADIVSMQIKIDSILPLEEAKLKSTLGGLVGDERKEHLRKIDAYTSGDVKHDLELTIRARKTQIERLQLALQTKEGNMFDGTGDDDLVVQELHFVKGKPVTLKFRARDVIHSAYLPYFRTQMNVVPGLPTEFTFTPTISTTEMQAIKNDPNFDYYLVCNKICGNAHFNMKMKVVVEDEKSYAKWLSEQAGLFVKKEVPADEAKPEATDTTSIQQPIVAQN